MMDAMDAMDAISDPVSAFAAMHIRDCGVAHAVAELLRAVAGGDLLGAYGAADRADQALADAGAAPLPAPRLAAAVLAPAPPMRDRAALAAGLDFAAQSQTRSRSRSDNMAVTVAMVLTAAVGVSSPGDPVLELLSALGGDWTAGDSPFASALLDYAMYAAPALGDGMISGRVPAERLAAQLAFEGVDSAPWAAVALVVRDDVPPAFGLIAALMMAAGDAAAASAAFGDWTLASEVLAEKFIRL